MYLREVLPRFVSSTIVIAGAEDQVMPPEHAVTTNLERILAVHQRCIPQAGSLGRRLGRFLPTDPYDQQPGTVHHEDERGHHADAHDIEAPGVTGKEHDGADLLEHETRKAANGPPNQRGVGYVGRSRRLADAAVEDELNHEQHQDHVGRYHLGTLTR